MARGPAKRRFFDVSQERLYVLWGKITADSHQGMLREQALEAVYYSLPSEERSGIRALLELNGDLVFVYKLFLDCGHALECMMIADSLVPRTAWSSRKLTHAQTTAFAWASFLNSAYQYREIVKATFSQIEKVCAALDVPKPESERLKRVLKEIEACVGRHVALRGRNTHNFIEHNKYVVGIEAMELLRRQGQRYEKGRHYVARAKDLLRTEMHGSISGCIEILERFHADVGPLISTLLDEVGKRVASAGVDVARSQAA